LKNQHNGDVIVIVLIALALSALTTTKVLNSPKVINVIEFQSINTNRDMVVNNQ